MLRTQGYQLLVPLIGLKRLLDVRRLRAIGKTAVMLALVIDPKKVVAIAAAKALEAIEEVLVLRRHGV